MTTFLVVPLSDLDRGPVLAGRLNGEADREALEHRARRAPTTAVLIDCRGVETLTSSYFLSGIWPLWVPSVSGHEIFPMIANAPVQGLDDVELALRLKQAAIWHVKLTGKIPSAPRLLGTLDSTLNTALDLIVKHGELTAAQFASLAPDSGVGASAWNNRLVALYQARLVKRHKEGKQLFYTPAWKEIVDG